MIIWSELFHLGDREIPLTTISHRKAPHYVLKGPSLLAMIVLAMEFEACGVKKIVILILDKKTRQNTFRSIIT